MFRRQPSRFARIRAPARISAALVALLLAAAVFAADGPIAEASREFENGKYQQAAAILRTALAQDAQNPAFYYWLARCYFELGEYDRAISSARRAVELAPSNSEYHLWLGRAYGRKAEHASWFSGLSLAKKTVHEFEEAVRCDPQNLAAQRDLIEFYYRAPGIAGGGDDKALRQIQELASLDPIEGHLARGDHFAAKKKFDQAEAEFRQVLLAKPTRVSPYFDVADFYLSHNDASHAEEAIEAAARVDPGDRRLAYYRGAVRVLAGNKLPEAERLLKTYLETAPQRSDLPSHASAHEWLGRLYEREGQCQAAVEQYRKALELEPHDQVAQEALRRLRRCSPGT
ncbi:MAG TPA: tetratricopeptide repeat protein [Candidatus Acidoferrales bacterium]|nr:tetratricopeptide repeat protein [Candidatus Acidoferrales bacterium]